MGDTPPGLHSLLLPNSTTRGCFPPSLSLVPGAGRHLPEGGCVQRPTQQGHLPSGGGGTEAVGGSCPAATSPMADLPPRGWA